MDGSTEAQAQTSVAPPAAVEGHRLNTGRVVVLGLFLVVAGILAFAGSAASQTANDAPWGIGAVTTSGTTPDLVKRSLPQMFQGYVLNTDDIPGFSHPRPRTFATEAENLAYVEPGDPEGTVRILVHIDRLRPETDAATAIDEIVRLGADKPSFAVEQQETGPEAPVPFALTNETNVGGGELFSLVWGARDGAWVYTVAATTAGDRESFVRALATRLDLEAALTTATARPDAVSATMVALSTREAALAATVAAQATQHMDDADALATAECVVAEEATAQAELAATATAFATQVAGTISAQATQNIETGANELATAEADAANLQATVDALATQQVIAAATATVLSEQANTGYVDTSQKFEFSIQVDTDGLIDGDEDAIEAAVEAIREALAPYEDCQVGFVLAFGWSGDIGTGIAVATAVNDILKERFPEQFANAAFESFANLKDPEGQVDLDVYFYRGCDAAGTAQRVQRSARSKLPLQLTLDASPSNTDASATATETPPIVQPSRTPDEGGTTDERTDARSCAGSADGDILDGSSATTSPPTPFATKEPTADDTTQIQSTDTGQPTLGPVATEVSPTEGPTEEVTRSLAQSEIVAEFPDGAGATNGLRFASDGVYFALDLGGNIVVADAAGNVVASLGGSAPVWSPLGGILLFDEGIGGVAIWDRDNGQTSSITALTGGDEDGVDYRAGWTEDGTLLYLRAFGDGRAELHGSAWDGSDDQVLWEGELPALLARPVATDAGVVALTEAGWVRIGLDGSADGPAPNPWGAIGDPVASPYGSAMVFETGGQLVVASAENPWVSLGEPIPYAGSGFAFSPSGEYLVVADGTGLAIYDLYGSPAGRLDGATVSAPGWSEVGIYFVDQAETPTLRRIDPGAFAG